MKEKLVLGMPHLLANYDLNLNHISKIFGDNHWHYMLDKPSESYIDNNRIYQSFLRIDFDIKDSFKEDDTFDVSVTGEYIDDYIFKTNHQFNNNIISMFTIGIYVEDGKLQKANSKGVKDLNFWSSHKNNKNKEIDLTDTIDFPTYYNIDFNCAQILYCANYLKFVYQYLDINKIDANIKRIDFFGNISPGSILTVGKSNNDIAIFDGKKVIARIEWQEK